MISRILYHEIIIQSSGDPRAEEEWDEVEMEALEQGTIDDWYDVEDLDYLKMALDAGYEIIEKYNLL